MEAQILDLLRSIEERLARVERLLTEPMEEIRTPVGMLKVTEPGVYPDDRQLEKKMRKAAEGKVLENGVMRNPNLPRPA